MYNYKIGYLSATLILIPIDETIFTRYGAQGVNVLNHDPEEDKIIM